MESMDWIDYYKETPEVNSVGKCLRTCEVILEDGSSCFAYYCNTAGWFTSRCFYFEYRIESPVKYWRYYE